MRRLTACLAGMAALALLLAHPSCEAGPSMAHTTRTFVVAYNYTYDADALDKMARDFDVIVWGNPPEHFRAWATAVKQKNPGVINLFYRDLQAMHPEYADWKVVEKQAEGFLKDRSGTSRLIHRGWKWRAMDLSSPRWTDHLVSEVRRELDACPAWDGVFVDDVWTAFRDEFEREADHQAALPSQEYVEHYFHHTDAVIGRLKQSVGKRLVIVNEDFVNGDYLSHCDGAMMEIFVHSSLFDTLHVDPWYWKLSLELLEKSAEKKKIFLANSMIKPGAAPDQVERVQRLCLATYLLGMHPQSYYSFNTTHHDVPTFSEWRLALGAPVGRCHVESKIYSRKFAHGLVMVNPELSAASVNLRGTWRAWGHEEVSHLDLPPQSGVVLLERPRI